MATVILAPGDTLVIKLADAFGTIMDEEFTMSYDTKEFPNCFRIDENSADRPGDDMLCGSIYNMAWDPNVTDPDDVATDLDADEEIA